MKKHPCILVSILCFIAIIAIVIGYRVCAEEDNEVPTNANINWYHHVLKQQWGSLCNDIKFFYRSFLLLLAQWISMVRPSITRRWKINNYNQQSFQSLQSLSLKIGNEVSVYHRIGQACEPSHSICDKSSSSGSRRRSRESNALVPNLNGKDQSDLKKRSGGGPYPGLVLHVYQSEKNVVHDLQQPKVSASTVNIYHGDHNCCPQFDGDSHKGVSKGMNGYDSDLVRQYELVTMITDNLGAPPLHIHDFAYRPVIKMASNTHRRWRDDEWWWDTDSFESNYERVGSRAFAGGSHGEVWAGRRRCHQVANFGSDSGQGHSHERSNQSHRHKSDDVCDGDQELVMKRLRVGQSIELMEAGLREVYFGDILGRSDGSGELFTKYVDHFFHQGLTVEDLELWIVYEYAGQSLRSYLYTPFDSGDFIVYQHSNLWTWLRTGIQGDVDDSSSLAIVHQCQESFSGFPDKKDFTLHREGDEKKQKEKSKDLLKSILRQVLTSAAKLHERGIVHRDIKPSNIMCKADSTVSYMRCVLGDFSSAFNEFTAERLYHQGPSPYEQTDEYAPPEVLFGSQWKPFYERKPESYDSWSIGVVALELLLGSPNVFSVDKRTAAVLTNKLKRNGADDKDIRRALYLAALSQFCIYNPSNQTDKDWPLREGDPLEFCSMAKTTCTIQDFHNALRARDPLGLGFSASLDPLLHLIWGLLAWDPKERLTALEALEHYYFTEASDDVQTNALHTQTLDPRLDMNIKDEDPDKFTCPKCGRVFDNLQSCQTHATSRRHARFCTYDRSKLPKCLNAHSMLPSHPTSGYCDIQGRRRVIEDFHTVHLHDEHQFFGVFDGHNGNLASKYASARLYKRIVEPLSDVDEDISHGRDWKTEVEGELTSSFEELHDGVLEAMELYPGESMSYSGTTATMLFVTKDAIIIASVGDSRAVLSLGASFNSTNIIRASQLTVDHKASNPFEQERVKDLGGFIAQRGGTLRVNGTLVLTRSIGDAHLARYLSRTPHVISMTKDEVKQTCRHDDDPDFPCFIILASDGLWDEISNEEAVAMVEIVIRRFGNNWREGGFQEAAEVLTQEAYVRGSTDNIGVCVVAIT